MGFFFTGENFSKGRNSKLEKISDFGGIPLPEVILFYFCQICACVCVCVAMNIEGWLKNCTPHVVYTQIWLSRLSLPMGDRHLSYIKKFIKKKPLWVATPLLLSSSLFFFSGEISPKRKRHSKLKNSKIKCFWNKKEVVKVTRFFYTWFLMCSQQVSIFWAIQILIAIFPS